jgi:hypothetical protein
MFSWGLSADYIKLNSIENNSTTMEISDSFYLSSPIYLLNTVLIQNGILVLVMI